MLLAGFFTSPANTRPLRSSLAALLLLACPMAALAQSQAASSQESFTLNGSVTLLVEPSQPGPVKLAANDLASDLHKVFGTQPRIITSTANAAPVTIVLGQEASGAPADHAAAREAFSITTGAANWNGHPVHVIRLAGSGMLGTIYAIYQFSQQYLGVDPMYYWTDHEPQHRTAIQLPAALHEKIPPPVFRYRGFFINDEDLLTGWAPGKPQNHTGISLAVWNKICETILRLKGNMVVAGTWPFPNDPQDRIVEERGLYLNQHHAEPLGVNFSRWPAKVPYNFTADPQYIENAWKNAVNAYPKNYRILWEVGLRGLSDQPYSALDPSVRGNEKAQGHLISKAIADQIRIVHKRFPHAVFITDSWMEGAKLIRQGDLVIPPDVITVWADTGYGYLRDHGLAKPGEGAYIHVAMFNGRANQLSELTPVSRLFSSLGRFQKAGATSFLLVNTSDIRPVTMGATATMDFGWKGASIGSSNQFYLNWSRKEFGPGAAPKIAAVYKAYFKAPADFPGDPAIPYGDNFYHTMARALMYNTMVQWPVYSLPGQSPAWERPGVHYPYNPNWAPQQAEKQIQACNSALPRWNAVWRQAKAAEPIVPAARRDFYQAAVLTMIAINRDSNQMLLSLSQAIVALHNGDHATAVAKTNQAIQALNALKLSESRAEYGKWKHWYRGDWLTGVDRTRKLLATFAEYLQNPNTPVPLPVDSGNWEGYYHIQHYEGTRIVNVNPPASRPFTSTRKP